jgi:hypothetical protein
MPTDFRFDDLDLREEPLPVAKLDAESDFQPTTTVQYTHVSCKTIC